MTESASTAARSSDASETSSVTLSPSYWIPIVLVFSAIPLLLLQPWVSAVIGLFGLFLMYQAASLRLIFTPTALEVCRGETLIRRFPYADWQNWRIFWSPVPVLFYFKEVKSIHFVPVLFSPKELKTELQRRQLPIK